MQGWLSPHRISPRQREALFSLLDSPEPSTAVDLSRDLGLVDDFPIHATLIGLLTHLEMAEAEAAEHWCAIALRREELTWRLGRDPGTRVAAMDYFVNEQRMLTRPTVVDESALDRAASAAEADGITGLASGKTFRRAVRGEIRRAGRKIQEFSIALLDLDAFGRVNQDHGRAAGDGVLREVAALIRERLRDMDLAGRLGGGHFGLLLPLTRRTGAHVAVERIRLAVRDAFLRAGPIGRSVALTLSGGLATFPEEGDTAQRLLERAAEALALARERGGNQVILHHRERRQSARVRPIGMPVRALASRQGSQSPDSVRIRDISLEGALLEGPTPWKDGEEVLLRLPGDSHRPEALLEARVVRREVISGEKRDTHRAAVQLFVKPFGAAESLELLLEALKRQGVE